MPSEGGQGSGVQESWTVKPGTSEEVSKAVSSEEMDDPFVSTAYLRPFIVVFLRRTHALEKKARPRQ